MEPLQYDPSEADRLWRVWCNFCQQEWEAEWEREAEGAAMDERFILLDKHRGWPAWGGGS